MTRNTKRWIVLGLAIICLTIGFKEAGIALCLIASLAM